MVTLVVFNRFALAEFLRLTGTTKAQLASRAQVSPGYITDLIKGNKRCPTVKAIQKLARALDVDWRSLYYEVPASAAA